MKIMRLHTAVVTGVAAIALTAAGSLAVPTKAQAIEPITGAIIGGVIAGAVIGGAAAHRHDHTTVYSAPAPSYKVVERRCYYTTRKVFDPYSGGYNHQRVKVC